MPAINDDVLAFLRSRPISVLCTRSRENRPAEHECLLAEITADRVIGLVPEQLARSLAENVADNGDAALVVSRAPGDHRSVQLKGKITALGEARLRTDELAEAAERLLPVFGAYMPEATARVYLAAMVGQPMFQVRLEVRQVFNQTPGPGAGRPIEGGAA
jgi:hypothetical protein